MSTTTAPAPAGVRAAASSGSSLRHLDAVHDHLLWLTLDADRAAALTAEVGLRALGRLADGRVDAAGRRALLRATHGRLRDVARGAPTDAGLAALQRANPQVDAELLRRLARVLAGLPLDVVATLHLTTRLGLGTEEVATILGVQRDEAARLRDRANAAARAALTATAVDPVLMLTNLAAAPPPGPVLDLLATAADRAPEAGRRRHPAWSWIAAAVATAVAGGLLAAGVREVVTADDPAATVVAAEPVDALVGDGAEVGTDGLAAGSVDADRAGTVVELPAEPASSTDASPGSAATASDLFDSDDSSSEMTLDTGRADAAPDDPAADEDAEDGDEPTDESTGTGADGDPTSEPSPEPSESGPLGGLLDPGDA